MPVARGWSSGFSRSSEDRLKPVLQPPSGQGGAAAPGSVLAFSPGGVTLAEDVRADVRAGGNWKTMYTTSIGLLDQLRDQAASQSWIRFVDLYTPLLHYWASRLPGMQEADIHDLVQDVFLILLAKLPTFHYDQGRSFPLAAPAASESLAQPRPTARAWTGRQGAGRVGQPRQCGRDRGRGVPPVPGRPGARN